MNENFSTLLNSIMEKCDGKNFNNKKFNSKLYPFTTENISGYIDEFDLKDKSLLTVGSSLDQVINASLKDCKDITLLDINPYTKFYFYLKLACILELDRNELLKFLRFVDYPETFKYNYNVFNKETYNKIKGTLRLLDYESYLVWDEIFQNFKPIDIRENLFSYDEGKNCEVVGCNPYLQNDSNYNLVRKKLKHINIDFINSNILEVNLSKTFDNIWLSNIGTWLGINSVWLMTNKMISSLNENGKLLISYLYDTTIDLKYHSDWQMIYNLDYVFNMFKDYNIDLKSFMGVRGHKFNDEKIKDSILIYKKQ